MTMMMSTMPAITTMRLKIILKVPTMNALMPKKLIMPNVLPKNYSQSQANEAHAD